MNERNCPHFIGEEVLRKLLGQNISDIRIPERGQKVYKPGIIQDMVIQLDTRQGECIRIDAISDDAWKDEVFSLEITDLAIRSFSPGEVVIPERSVRDLSPVDDTRVVSIELCAPLYRGDPPRGLDDPSQPIELIILNFEDGQALGIAASLIPIVVDLLYSKEGIQKARTDHAGYCVTIQSRMAASG